MHCEHCGAPMLLDRDRGMLVCGYCGAQAVPETTDDGVQVLGPTPTICPVCSKSLFDGLVEARALLYCEHCRGMLIPMDSFAPLISDLRAHRERSPEIVQRRDEADAARHLRCPKCSGEMDAHPYGGGGNVNIDSCETCAVIWLDGQELRRIVVAPDHQPLYLTYGHDHPRPRK